MKKLLIFSVFLLSSVIGMADSIYTSEPEFSAYDKRIHRYRKHWAALIPTQFVIQNAGNMGLVSVGSGWNYGKRNQWETQFLIGFVPKHQSTRPKITTTMKENYIPWSYDIKPGVSIEPLTTSLYLNAIYGHEFWKKQPSRYPEGYYFMSTTFRFNVAVGQRITVQIPQKYRRYNKSVSFFYELSTCDLYIRNKVIDHNVKLSDIIGLSLGIKLQTL